MTRLYLVRHATPNIRPDVPPREWTLSDKGIKQAQELAGIAESWGIEAMYSSSEPKARSTALIIGDALGLSVGVVDGFDELHMPDWIGNADEFNELVRAILGGDARSDARGAETADAAAERFAAGVRIVTQGKTPAAIASHGRVLTAYLSRVARLDDPYDFWRSIPMPGWACIELEGERARIVRGFADTP